MIDRAVREVGVICLSLLVAFGLSLLPVPMFTSPFIPDWALLAVLYWIIYLPQCVGLGVAWLTGLLTDVLTNSLLGEHALASVLVAYFALKFYRRLRSFSIGQQMISVALLLAIYRAILFWAQGIIQQPLNNHYWFPVATGMLLWPLLAAMFGDFQRKWRVE
jgi:rod shape-determining protein MreD